MEYNNSTWKKDLKEGNFEQLSLLKNFKFYTLLKVEREKETDEAIITYINGTFTLTKKESSTYLELSNGESYAIKEENGNKVLVSYSKTTDGKVEFILDI